MLVILFSVCSMMAQGTLYVSLLSNPTQAVSQVGNDSWNAVDFRTGTNSSGYSLNSLQVLMGNASGNPSGIIVSLYNLSGNVPGTPISILNGPEPTAAGNYSYTASSISLQPATRYFVVMTSVTPVSTGAYNWIAGDGGGSASEGWIAGISFRSSSDGINWNATRHSFLFAVYATAIPEPSTTSLIAIGGLALGLCRRTSRRKKLNRGFV